MHNRNADEKRRREKEVLSLMIRIYCKGVHGGRSLCPDCAALEQYAAGRVDRCPFMESKRFCSSCPVHCYSPEKREAVRLVMRYAGPRMLFRHPIMALQHLLDSRTARIKTQR